MLISDVIPSTSVNTDTKPMLTMSFLPMVIISSLFWMGAGEAP